MNLNADDSIPSPDEPVPADTTAIEPFAVASADVPSDGLAAVAKPARKRRRPKTAAEDDAASSTVVDPETVPATVPAVGDAPAMTAGGDDDARRKPSPKRPRPSSDDKVEDVADIAPETVAAQMPDASVAPVTAHAEMREAPVDASPSETTETADMPIDADASATPAAVVAPSIPPDINELFAQVLSGVFDSSAEPVAGQPAVAEKRVLAPEPEAPKLHKVLAQAGVGSRRDMEQMISEGLITVNGQPAHTGQRISFGDRIAVNGKPIKVRIHPLPARLIAYHKPAGEVVTHDDPQQRPTVFRRLPRLQQGKWQSVGRLDLNTEGLLLFTNSGQLANQLMHPRFGVEREYAVRLLGRLDDETTAKLIAGVELDGQKCAFRSVADGGGEGANHWYRVVITEGRNREVRRLFEAVGLTVSRLIRIRYGSVVLPRGLKRGVWVDLTDADLRAVRQLVGVPQGARPEAGGDRPADPRNGQRAGNQGRDGRQNGRPDPRPVQPRDDRGPARNGPRNPRNNGNGAGPTGPGAPVFAEARPGFSDQFDPDFEEEIDHSRIPNPLEQTFDKRFVQNPRGPAGGRGFGQGGGGFGQGGSAPHGGPRTGAAPKKPGAPREPDPMQTSVGYIGGDAFHRKGGGRNGGGQNGGNRGGNRGGGFGGGFRGR